MFGGELPSISILISNTTRSLGTFRYCSHKHPDGTLDYSDFSISISKAFDRTKEEWEDVLLHEMVHYKLTLAGHTDDRSHGEHFRKEIERINRDFGRNLTVKEIVKESAGNGSKKVVPHFLLILHMRNGDFGFIRMMKNKIFDFRDEIGHYGAQIAGAEWVATLNPFFNNYSRTSKFKYYVMEKKKFLEQGEVWHYQKLNFAEDGNSYWVEGDWTPDPKYWKVEN